MKHRFFRSLSTPLTALLLVGALVTPAQAEDIRFLAFGDSITVGHGDGDGDDIIICPDNVQVGGYPPRLRPLLQAQGIEAVFLNYGVCGERTGSGVTRIDSVLEADGDVIILMQGTNDVSARVGYETTVFNIDQMAQKAEAADVVPMIASIVPRGPESGTDTNNGKTQLIGNELRMLAEENDWAFADPFNALFNQPDFFERFFFDQLHPNSSGYDITAGSMVAAAVVATTKLSLCGQLPRGPCVADDSTLCLNQGRFQLQARWRDFGSQVGPGHAVPQTNDTGAFFWFNPENIEMVIKVLDGRAINDHFWVFYGALSNVEFTLAVRDTETGECKEYLNPLETFASVGDTSAFFAPLP